MSLRKQAMNLLRHIPGRGVINRIFEIFIIRAARSSAGGVATVIELPTYLAGGYGGQDGLTDYYTPAVIVDFGAMMDGLTRRVQRRDENDQLIPSLPVDKFKGRAPLGGGRVVIGDVPAWEAYRQALNDTTGVFTACPSAVMVAVCPALAVEAGAIRPYARTLSIQS
jgi:hypothetical protein